MKNAGSVRQIELQKTVIIDDQEYKMIMFMPSRSFKLGARVAKLIGEPAAAMAAAAGDESRITDALPIAIRALLSKLDEDEVWQLITELLTCVSQNGQMLNIDLHFKGKIGSLFELVTQVMEYQFADFFGAIGKAVAGIASKATKA